MLYRLNPNLLELDLCLQNLKFENLRAVGDEFLNMECFFFKVESRSYHVGRYSRNLENSNLYKCRIGVCLIFPKSSPHSLFKNPNLQIRSIVNGLALRISGVSAVWLIIFID